MQTEKLVIEDKEFHINVYTENRNNSRASIGKNGIKQRGIKKWKNQQ